MTSEPVNWELQETGPAEAGHSVLLLPGGACSAAFYDELMAEQIASAREDREGELGALLAGGDTWTIS